MNKKYIHVKVKFDDFINYQKENGTYYLDKKYGYSIWASSKSRMLNGFKPLNEIFDGIESDYEYSPESTENKLCIIFYTKSNTKYRFDLSKELDTNIYHLAFTLDNREIDNYDELSNLGESKEVLGRLSYILKDLSEKLNIKEFCIGATGNPKKDAIYKYMMQYVKSWKKKDTKEYNLGWGLYFTI